MTIDNDQLLAAALQGLEAQRDRIVGQIANLRQMLGKKAAATTEATESPVPTVRRKRRKPLSDEARARIAAAQKKRWAAFRKESN